MSIRKVKNSLEIGSKKIEYEIGLINYLKDYKDVELTDELRAQEEQKLALMKATLIEQLDNIYKPEFERLKELGVSTKDIKDLMKWAIYLEVEKMDDR